MINITWWWPLLLLPAPLLVRYMLPQSAARMSALPVPLLIRRSHVHRNSWVRQISVYGLWLFWIFLIIASCRPYWHTEPVHRVVTGRDLLIAIDISGSMRESDMINGNQLSTRIDSLKQVASEFIQRRDGDRIGLILFGTHAYSYVPLTFDRNALVELLDDISTGLAGRLTAIGDAIALAVNLLAQQESRHKVLILITDGSNTAGDEDPVNAARIANSIGMTIYTIGVGNDATTLRQLTQDNNLPAGTELNESLLRKIAAITEGQYFRARDSVELENIYQSLDELEPAEYQSSIYRPRTDLFPWFLATGLLGFCLTLTLSNWQSTIRKIR